MNLYELTKTVSLILQDTSLEPEIIPILNNGVQEIAGGMQSTLGSWITPPLPELFTIDTITTITDAAYVSMPDTFQRDLQFASKSNGAELEIANSFIEFAESAPLLDRSGAVYVVAEQGGNIYYQNIPSEVETITVHFYRLPVNMVTNTDEPDGIPTHLQRGLLVNYAAWKLFEMIEDGLEGPGFNTQRYRELFLTSLRTLELTVFDDVRGFNLIKEI